MVFYFFREGTSSRNMLLDNVFGVSGVAKEKKNKKNSL